MYIKFPCYLLLQIYVNELYMMREQCGSEVLRFFPLLMCDISFTNIQEKNIFIYIYFKTKKG